jgi:SOS-response transcriptional repressor LexA
LLKFIDDFIKVNGYSPSYREIMSGLEYNSVATVALHVNNLIRRGHLRKRNYSARSLELVNPLGAEPKPVITKQLKSSEEKWLVDKVEQYFKQAEMIARPEERELDQLYVLVGALKVLGLDGAAHAYIARLSDIKKKSADTEYSV